MQSRWFSYFKPLFPQCVIIAVILVLLPSQLFAQWSGDGVQVFDAGTANTGCCPDGMGGIWIAQMVYPGISETHVVVQHIDGDGYRSFGLDGLHVTSVSNSYLCGIETGLDGDCVVMYTIPVEVGQDIVHEVYAQRITQSGELQWGDEGIDVSMYTADYKIPVYWDTDSSTESDDAGGLWGFWVMGAGASDIWLCGVNADGSLKLPDGDLNVAEVFYLWTNRFKFVPDGSGGLAFIYPEVADGYNATKRHIRANRVFADGTQFYNYPRIILDWPEDEIGGYGDPLHIRRDPNGGYVITTYGFWQRTSNNMNPLWDLRGAPVYDWEPSFYNLNHISNPVVLSDRSVLQLCTNSEFDLPYLEQVEYDGTRSLGTDWGPVAGDSVYNPVYPGPDFAAPDRNSVITVYKAAFINDHSTLHQMVQRVTPEGSNLWSHIVAFFNEDEPTFGLTDHMVAYLDDQSICYVFMHNPGDTRILYAYKLNIEDGSVAGDTTSVSEIEHDLNPNDYDIALSVYPNPFNSSATIQMQIPQTGSYQLHVTDILGRTVTRTALNLSTGTNHFSYSLPPSQSSGIYFVQLRQGDTVSAARKILILR